MPAGRFKPAPAKRRRTPLQKLTDADAHESRQVKRAAAAVGTATVRGARQVQRGAERDVAVVQREAAQKPRHRRGIIGGIKHGFGHFTHTLDETKPVAAGVAKFPGALGKAVALDTRDSFTHPSLSKLLVHERTADLLMGKSAANLLAHGDTSHKGAAALELGAILPVGKGVGGVVRGAGKVAKVGKETEEAAQVERAAAAGGGPPVRPREAPAEIPEGPAPEQRVREALGPARARAAAQKGLGREERARRITAAQEASAQAGGGVAGHKAALSQLKGELPKVKFQHLREGNLSQDDLDHLFRQIQEHPELRPFEKLHAQQGLLHAFEEGRVPQPSQIKLLQTVFGQDAAQEIAKAGVAHRARDLTIEALNVPRSLMASFDLSAPFRQGLVAGARHPRIFFKNFGHMVKALGSERAYQGILDEIHARPTFPQMQEAGVKFTELGRELSHREEQFMSGLAERIPVAGRAVHASGRAYTGFLDKMRADMFDEQVRLARQAGVNVEDRKQLRGIARLVNSATGRGDLGPIESWAPAMNAMFFSPRLIASRVNLLNPVWYATLPPYARRQAIRSMVGLGAAAGSILGLGAYLGASVTTDPRSADFAKLRLGNTRADLLGGFQQYVRVGSQLATGKIISSTTGKTMNLGPGMGSMSRKDILDRFLSGKFSPTASFVNDFFKGTSFDGQPFSVKQEVLSRTIPLVAQDAYSLYGDQHSIPLAIAGYAISAFGIGMQTYSNQQSLNQIKEKHQAYGEKILEGAIKTHLLPPGSHLTPQLQSALNIREARYENREKMGASDTRSRFEADVRFLEERHVIPKAKADRAVDWAKGEKRDYLVDRELRHLSDWYFDDMYGNALADARQKLRARGYELPRLP